VIPFVSYNRQEDQFGTTECVICMETFRDNEKLRCLSVCKHIFHSECLITWFGSDK